MSRRRILVLDRIVADQIAAGEVVERPGSAIKELVENSLDAGATRVRVEIDGGGAARMRVLDNGSGIASEDVEAAFFRHATSKISRLDDIARAGTYGFRGEALPSIASVSRITVHTRSEETLAGTRLELEAGELLSRREAGCPVGTDIEVRDLFFNTPARLKFLKRESTETGHCVEAVMRLALVRPEVAFGVVVGGRTSKELPRAERIEERISELFSDERLARFEAKLDGVEVLAVLGPPERARAGAGSLYTFVNRRFVRDRALLKAVHQAFGGTLEKGRYPVGTLAVEMPSEGIDVNAHPQKTEVRFADPRAVYRAVSRTVAEMVSRSVWSLGEPARTARPEAGAESIAEEDAAYRSGSDRLVPPPSFPAPRPGGVRPRRGGPDEPGRRAGRPAPGPGGPIRPEPQRLVTSDRERHFSSLRFVGQAQGTFLLLEDEDDLVILDQHAAHERVTFERLREQLAEGRVSSQRLLVPHAVDLGPAEAERIEGLAEALERLGLEIQRSGPERISVRSVPAELAGASPDRLLAEMVLALEESRDGSRGESDDRALATIACHGSIRGGREVGRDEAIALLEEMDRIEMAGHCPHGRPVLARIPWREIRRRVGRD